MATYNKHRRIIPIEKEEEYNNTRWGWNRNDFIVIERHIGRASGLIGSTLGSVDATRIAFWNRINCLVLVDFA